MNKNESKYFNTAVKMDKALIALLEKKEFEYITIKELCDKAGVNRSTFYLHYENTSDLLKETTRYIINNFLSYFESNTEKESIAFDGTDIKNLFFITPKYLLPYLTFVKDNGQLFKTSLKRFNALDFESIYKNLFKHVFDPLLERFSFPESERPYIMKFYLTGITAVTMEWLRNNCSDPTETVCDIIIKCIMGRNNILGSEFEHEALNVQTNGHQFPSQK